jgi:hypothetical protein
MPATAVPVPSFFGPLSGDDHLVAFAGPDLVVAAGAAVGLVGFVGLDVPYVDAVVGFRPAVRAHARVTVSPPAAGSAHAAMTRGVRTTWMACASNETTAW